MHCSIKFHHCVFSTISDHSNIALSNNNNNNNNNNNTSTSKSGGGQGNDSSSSSSSSGSSDTSSSSDSEPSDIGDQVIEEGDKGDIPATIDDKIVGMSLAHS